MFCSIAVYGRELSYIVLITDGLALLHIQLTHNNENRKPSIAYYTYIFDIYDKAYLYLSKTFWKFM